MGMSVAFIIPNVDKRIRYGKLYKLGSYLPSLGIAYISAVAEKEGHRVSIIDAEVNDYSDDQIIAELLKTDPKVVGFQTFYNTIGSCLRLARKIKERSNDTIIIFGGIQATLFPEEALGNGCVDYVVMGEGEIVFRNLLRDIHSQEQISKIRGLAYKHNHEIVKNTREENIMDLDSLPIPARHLFPMSLYKSSGNLRGRRNLHIMSSRGCPFACTFCESHMTFGKTNRFHSAVRVIEEITRLRDDYGADAIQFYDESFTLNKRRVYELCEQMIRHKLNLPWSCFTRVNLIDMELLKAMKSAGCYQIFFGVESGSPRLLKLINKLHTRQQVKRALCLVNKVKMQSTASFIIALPTETKEDVRETIEFAKEINPTFANFLLFCPFPGTDIYELSMKNGTVLEKDPSKWSNFNEKQVVYLPHGRSKDDVLNSVRQAYRRFYLRPRYYFNILRVCTAKEIWQKFLTMCRAAYNLLLVK